MSAIPVKYSPRAPVRHEDVVVRGLRHRVHHWGEATAPPLFLLHGWVDTGMSFQFLADTMAGRWHVIAPDWRGFGDTDWDPNGYWFPDYLADLDALLELYCPHDPVRVIGHSMGGNVAWLYAGVRPERLSHVASLDVAGFADTDPDEAPGRYARWLDQLRDPASFSPLSDRKAVLALVRKLAPRLDPAHREFIADQWARPDATGNLRLPHDPRHKHVNPVLYRRAEARACWRRIRARALLVLARESQTFQHWQTDRRAEIMECMPHLVTETLDGGHMLHLEQPAALARILDRFLSDS